MKILTVLALLAAVSLASAQEYKPSAAAIKSVDVQAVAFTERHCSDNVVAKPPRPASADQFKAAIRVMEVLLKDQAKKEPSIQLKTNMVNQDLFLLTISSAKSGRYVGAFFVMFRDQGQLYLYTCELK